MPYYQTCPGCGAHLDPGERCDCREAQKAPASAANTDGGRGKRMETPVSILTITESGGIVNG